jgi:hypothetical protein
MTRGHSEKDDDQNWSQNQNLLGWSGTGHDHDGHKSLKTQHSLGQDRRF